MWTIKVGFVPYPDQDPCFVHMDVHFYVPGTAKVHTEGDDVDEAGIDDNGPKRTVIGNVPVSL